MRRPHIAAGVAAAVFVASGGYYLYERARSRTCVEAVSWPLVYDFRMDEASRPLAEPGEKRVHPSSSAHFSGELSFGLQAGFDLPAGHAALVARATPKLRREGGREFREFTAYKHGVVVELDPSCRVVRLTFDGRETFEARSTLQRIIGLLDLGRVEAGETEKVDQFGASALVRRSEGDAVVWSRQRVITPPVVAARRDELRITSILRSAFTYGSLTSGPWHERVEGGEKLQGRVGERESLHELEYTLALTRKPVDDASVVAAADIPARFRVDKKLGEPFRGVDRPSVYDQVAPAQPDAPQSLAEARQRFLDLLPKDPRGAKLVLVDYLRAHPEAAAELADEIKIETYADEVLVHVLHALAKSGVDEAQSAFADLIRDADVGVSTKLRVLFAVGEIRRPGDALIGALREQHAGVREGGERFDDVASTALLATGIVAANLRDVAPTVVEELAGDLRGLLQAATEPAVRANVIDAMGNTGLGELAPELTALARSSSPEERLAALQALPQLPVEGREELLREALGRDEVVAVRNAAARSLATVGIRKPETVAAVREGLRREQDGTIRETVVGALAAASRRLPEAKAATLDHLRDERDVRVLEAAGRYLGAEELSRVARRRGH
jgi:hypothetical protein